MDASAGRTTPTHLPDAKLYLKMTNPDESQSSYRRYFEDVAVTLAIVGVVAFGVGLIYLSYFSSAPQSEWLREIVAKHPGAAIGIPIAGTMATCVVFLFRAVSGPIEFEIVGVKLKGGSGPAILWTIAFLSIATAMKLLW